MPAPKKFLVASTSLPLALDWGWNLSLYVGILLGLLTLMLLLLWMLLKQLRNSVGKSMLQPVRSFRQPHALNVCNICDAFLPQAYRGSVRPFVNFNAKHDAEILHKAMKGIGTDEDAILMLLAARSNDQRQQIKAAYKKAYGKDLVSALKSELGGLFESLIVALMTPPILYDASQLHKALKGAGTDDDVLIEILASRTGEEIKDIIKVYKKEFSAKLEKDICSDTSGHYQKLLVILLQGSREEGVDEGKIEKDAKDLYAAGEGKFGTDEEKIIQIIGNRSTEHLRKVFDAYKKHSGSNIEDSIEGETTGNLENLLLAVVKCARSVPDFFAERLYTSMRRAGTDDSTLMRIMVSRSEVDMLDIRASFKKKYGASLYTTIQEDTTGDYQKALLYLCGGND
uniref:annexin A5a n=1 Tax=Scatophagus argus TaxID=75038 RepID=UPI001ED7FD27|nr:annexin A5a [Scatophagus argus]